MKKLIALKSIILLLDVVSMTSAWASPIDVNQAQAIASRFMYGKKLQSVNLQHLQHGQHAPSQVAYHVFNAVGANYRVILN